MTFKRRNFLKGIVASSVTAVAAKASLASEPHRGNENIDSQGEFVFLTAPYLQHPTIDGMTVCWLTNRPAFSHVVYWNVESPETVMRQYTVENGLVLANNTINKIRLDNLESGKEYAYKVVSKEILKFEAYSKAFGGIIESEILTFSTVDKHAETASLLIMNDIHDRPQSFALLERLYGNKNYGEVVLNGDTFDFQTGQQQLVDHLIKPTTSLFSSNKAFTLMRGNHETRGAFAYALDQYFENIDHRLYFTFKRGPVFFIALDTGEDKPDDDDAYYGMAAFDPFREKQAAWLADVLNSPEAKNALYRVVIMHIPPYHSGDWHGPMHCREVFGPVLEHKNVDLVISGHTHRYGVHQKQAEHSYPILIGGGPKEGERTIIKIEANQKELVAKIILETGTDVGSVTLKPNKLA